MHWEIQRFMWLILLGYLLNCSQWSRSSMSKVCLYISPSFLRAGPSQTSDILRLYFSVILLMTHLLFLCTILHTEKFPPIPSHIFPSPQPQTGKELHLASLCDPGQAFLPLLDSVFLAVVPVFWGLFCLCYPMWLLDVCSLLWLSWEPDLMEIIFLKLTPLLPCV